MAPLTYVLPIRSATRADVELTDYLRQVARTYPVIVVDGSDADVFGGNRRAWGEFVHHIAPDPAIRCANGKVRGVNTALAIVDTPLLVIADDDVRYAPDQLDRLVDELDHADLVAPQNYFDPAPWHARWDAGRSLINRVTGGDFPGTLALRRAFVPDTGYDGDVLFENLELMRTVSARGGRVRRLPDLYVRRLPPTTPHFAGQRVRQAYDEWARPARLAIWLCVLPVWAVTLRRPRTAIAIPMLAATLAELGRRRAGARRYFHATCSVLAPAWVLERAVTVWFAAVLRLRGGVTYAGRRVSRAANSTRALRLRHEVAA